MKIIIIKIYLKDLKKGKILKWQMDLFFKNQFYMIKQLIKFPNNITKSHMTIYMGNWRINSSFIATKKLVW
jgi:hypothetical protein